MLTLPLFREIRQNDKFSFSGMQPKTLGTPVTGFMGIIQHKYFDFGAQFNPLCAFIE